MTRYQVRVDIVIIDEARETLLGRASLVTDNLSEAQAANERACRAIKLPTADG